MDNQNWNQQLNQNYGGAQYNQQNMGQQNWNQQQNQNYNGQGMNQQNWNQQNNMYNQPQTQYNQYGNQGNMYNQQTMYNNANNVKKSGKKIITFIVCSIVVLIIGFTILVASIIGIANKEKDPIKEYKIENTLDALDIDYEEYETVGILYGDGVSFENDNICIEVIDCDSESDAKDEFDALEEALEELEIEEDIDFNVTTSINGKNYNISTAYSTELEQGVYFVRVDDTVICSYADTKDSWEDLKEVMDELGY